MNKYIKFEFLMVIFLTFTLCNAIAGGNNEREEAKPAALTPVGTYPVVETPVEVTFLTLQTVFIEDLATNRFSGYLEDLTGVHVNWETIPNDALKEKLNLVLASGDYPDAFFGLGGGEGINPSTEMIYGAQEGVFMPLNDLIDNHMPNLKKLLDERDGIRAFITSPDGNIYSLPDFNECYHCSKAQKVWIYQPWLDVLGLSMPETTEEFYKVLIAFRDLDPNQNGKKDEIPYAGALKGWCNTIDMFILNSFIYDNINVDLDSSSDKNIGFYLDNGKIKTIVDSEEFKEGLTYLHKLYSEGLIYEGSYTQDSQQLTQLVEGPEDNIIGVVAGGYGGMFSTVGSERYRNFKALSPLEGPGGERNAKIFLQEPITGNLAISSECAYPEVIARYIDFLYSEKGTLMSRNGFEGEGWEYASNNEVGLDGKPAIWKLLKPWNDMDPQNDTFVMLGVRANTSILRNGQAMTPGTDMYSSEGIEPLLYKITSELYEPYSYPEKEIPTLRYLKEEQQKFATTKVEYAKYVRQSLVKFVVGIWDIEKDWNGYIEDLHDLGLDDILEINQKAYDRQLGKN